MTLSNCAPLTHETSVGVVDGDAIVRSRVRLLLEFRLAGEAKINEEALTLVERRQRRPELLLRGLLELLEG